jgi:glycosyltransferase involved in cell wall biosynthesis
MTAHTRRTEDVPDARSATQPRANGLFVFPKFPHESFAAVEMRALEPHLGSMRILSVRSSAGAGEEAFAQMGFQQAKLLQRAAGLGEYLKDFGYAFGKGRRFWPELVAALRENAARPSHVVRTLGALAAALRIARLAGSGAFDFVYLFWGHYLSCCIPLLKRAAPNVRTMVFLGAYGLADYPRSLGRWLRQADGVVTHSEGHLDEIGAILGAGAAPPVFMVHRGVDLEVCRGLRGAFARKEYDFSFVGRLVESKGPIDFVEALARLRREGVTFTAAIVGDGPLRTRLAALLEENDLTHAVQLLGLRPHAATLDIIRRTKILVLPSTKAGEVYPNVVKEAMALDTVCLAYDIPGVRAFNTQWPSVALCQANDIDDLAKAMGRLLHDRESCEEMVLNGRQVVQDFDLTRTTQERLARIAEVLRRPRSR